MTILILGGRIFHQFAISAVIKIYGIIAIAALAVPEFWAVELGVATRGLAPQSVSLPPLPTSGPCAGIVSTPLWVVLPLVVHYLYRGGILDEFAPGITLSCT